MHRADLRRSRGQRVASIARAVELIVDSLARQAARLRRCGHEQQARRAQAANAPTFGTPPSRFGQ
jgi:hypothetical protein